jgi:hypothetical protein
MNRPSADSISILAFDVLGTVVDWHQSIMREVRSMNVNVDPDRFALAWRAGYIPAMQKVMSGQLGWTLIDDLHRMILDHLLDTFKVTHLTEEEKRHLNRAWPFPAEGRFRESGQHAPRQGPAAARRTPRLLSRPPTPVAASLRRDGGIPGWQPVGSPGDQAARLTLPLAGGP